MKVGEYTVELFVAERFRLDGGGMFGVVPKTLWSRRIDCDELNRIPMAARLLLLRSSSRTVVVDLGCGTKWNDKDRQIFAVEDQGELVHRLPEVTDIILTHLHFDHCGGVSYLGADGVPTLAFPKARHHLSETNLQHGLNPPARERASYFRSNLEPLQTAQLNFPKLQRPGDEAEILPGIFGVRSDGHTKGMVWIRVGSGSDAVVFPTDLVPTSRHIPVPYVMAYDLCAETSMREKELFLTRAADEGWVVVFEHDPDLPAGRIGRDATGRFELRERVDIPEYTRA